MSTISVKKFGTDRGTVTVTKFLVKKYQGLGISDPPSKELIDLEIGKHKVLYHVFQGDIDDILNSHIRCFCAHNDLS